MVGPAIVVEKFPDQAPPIVRVSGTEFLGDCGSKLGNGAPAPPPWSARVENAVESRRRWIDAAGLVAVQCGR